MEEVKDISTAHREDISFDTLEFLGLFVPVLFAIFTIVLVAMSPDSGSTVPQKPVKNPEAIEQIHKR